MNIKDFLNNPWVYGIGATVIGGIILHHLYESRKPKKSQEKINRSITIPSQKKVSIGARKTTNIVSKLINQIPKNKDINNLYKKLRLEAKKWSSDGELIGSRIYFNFNYNRCKCHIVGFIYSQIRHERKKLWIPDNYEIIEEQNFEVKASHTLTKYRFWRLAIIKILETTASDIEKLEECNIQILPGGDDLNISIFFEKLPRKWSRHFDLKRNILYEGQTVIFKFKVNRRDSNTKPRIDK